MDSNSVREFIRKEVPDWDDEVMATARFKAFSGQRSDWEPKFRFWRDLILKISRHFGIFILQPTQVKTDWFNRGGLTPLCIDHVLFVMYNEGDILRLGDLVSPASAGLSQLLRKMRNLMFRSTMTPELLLEDRVIITPLLKEKAAEVVKTLSESQWSSSCIITMMKFQSICGGSEEASAVLSYLSGCGNAQYLSISRTEFIEGIKVSLSPTAVSSVSSLDCDVLHLIWTTEKLQQQLDAIDQRYDVSRKSALASLKSGNRKMALQHARELKLATESREKCMSLLNRVEEVLNVIADAESTKKVSEAIQIGARAIKENKISVEEVQVCLEELEEGIHLRKQVEKALESSPSYAGIDEEELEEEFKKLELELGITKTRDNDKTVTSECAESLSNIFSNLKLADGHAGSPAVQDTGSANQKAQIKKSYLEAV